MSTLFTNFERTLTSADAKQHIPFTFQVPAGTSQLTFRLTFSPHEVGDIWNMLTLTVFDPSGFRGAGHRHGTQHEVVIGAHHATYGYRPGAIQAGEWSVVVDTHMVMVGAPCAIRLEVSATDGQAEGQAQGLPLREVAGRTASRGRGWYRGDLHAHSLHSDASWDIPDLLAWARARRLDFATLSDHNTVSGLAEMDAACADDLLTMGGMELTTFWGHALALGLREWIDWRVTVGTTSVVTPRATEVVTTERTMEQIAAEVTERGGTFIIAHLMSIGDPYCTGCQWRYETMMPGTARVVEVWNGPWVGDGSSNNEAALLLAYRWLNEGHRLAFTAGTDNHADPEGTLHGFNVVYADDLSEQEILRAVRAGHVYLSSGPRLELNASVGQQQAMMGDALNVVRDLPIQITARWDGCPVNAALSLIADGKPIATLPSGASGSHVWELTSGQANWCLLTVRDGDGLMWALTNPIYFSDGIG